MATLSNFGIPLVGNGILHPKHQDRWRVLFTNIGGKADSKNLSFQCTKVQRPELTFEEVELHRYNSRAWVAGKHNWSECAISLEDDLTGTATQIIRAQLQKQKWLIGVDGPWLRTAPTGASYKFPLQIEMLDGNEFVVERWFLDGCWIKSSKYGELDYKSNEQVVIDLSLRYDNARQEIYQYSPDGGSGAVGGAGGSFGGV